MLGNVPALAPQGEVAALLYDSLEQIRIDTVGACDMAGVRANLDSARRVKGVSGDRDRDATVAEVVELFSREQLTGYELSEPQRALLETWRPWLSGTVSTELAPLASSMSEP